MVAKAEHGLRLAPNQSATKINWLLANALDGRDPDDLCFGTVDTWIAWTLSEGALHVTDHSNAAVTGLYSIHERGWSTSVCELLGVPIGLLPRIVDSSGVLGAATTIPGAPPIAALAGDQQASLAGQGCVTPGRAKITFGTGGMLDVCTGSAVPAEANRSANGTFPIVAWSIAGEITWGVEAVMLSAGSNIEWLRDDVGLIDSADDSHDVASKCETTDGVVYVPALHMPIRYTVRELPATADKPALRYTALEPVDGPRWGTLSAIDTRDRGKIRWQVKTPDPLVGGVLATAGDVLFTGEGNGSFSVFHARTGERLWQFDCGAGVNAPPVSSRPVETTPSAKSSGTASERETAYGGPVAVSASPSATARSIW